MSGSRAKILVIDDDPDVLLLLRHTLESEGFRATLAGEGETALRRIEAERPDVVLLDVMMPVMDGWAVLERISAMARPPLVIIVSAKVGEQDRVRALTLGAVEYITKPFNPALLVRAIREVLSLSQEEQALRRSEQLDALRY
jgi:two-component system OmpR family response regulator